MAGGHRGGPGPWLELGEVAPGESGGLGWALPVGEWRILVDDETGDFADVRVDAGTTATVWLRGHD